MSRTKSGPWVIGAALLCVVLFAVSWLVLISPRLTAAADTRDQVTQVEAQNGILRARTNQLREQFANLDEYKAELAGLRTQIPAEPQLAEAIRVIENLGATHQVAVVGVRASEAHEVIPVEQPAAPVPAPADEPDGDPAEGEDSEGSAEDEAVAPPVPTGPAPIEGFVTVPVSVTVLGPSANVQAFIGALQTEVERLMLVHNVTGTAADEEDASSGRPATEIGDLELVITGYLYVLTDKTAPADDVEEAEPTTLPTAPSGKNPFAPNSSGSGSGQSSEDSDDGDD